MFVVCVPPNGLATDREVSSRLQAFFHLNPPSVGLLRRLSTGFKIPQTSFFRLLASHLLPTRDPGIQDPSVPWATILRGTYIHIIIPPPLPPVRSSKNGLKPRYTLSFYPLPPFNHSALPATAFSFLVIPDCFLSWISIKLNMTMVGINGGYSLPARAQMEYTSPPSVKQIYSSLAAHHHRHMWIITGPAGCGKSTVAQYLASELKIPYIEGDDVSRTPFSPLPSEHVSNR